MAIRSIDEVFGTTWLRIYGYLIGILSTALDSCIIYCILCKTPKELKDYRYFLLMITMCDMCLLIFLLFFVQPVTLFPFIGAVITGPIKHLGSPNAEHFSVEIAIYFFASTLAYINLTFIYRYLCLVNDRFRDLFLNVKSQICIFIVGMMICLGFALSTAFKSWMPPKEFLPLIYEKFPEANGLLEDEVVFIFQARLNIIFTVMVSLSIPLSCFFNLGLAYLILRHLHSLRHSMTITTRKLQRRLIYALIVQTVSPMVLLGAPATVVYASQFLEVADSITTPAFGNVFVVLLTTHPIVNAISTLTFMPAYRRVLIRASWIAWIRSRCFRQRETATLTLVSAAQNSSSPSGMPNNNHNFAPKRQRLTITPMQS